MRNRRADATWTWAVTVAVALATVGAAWAQQRPGGPARPPAPGDDAGAAAPGVPAAKEGARRQPPRLGGQVVPREGVAKAQAADPLEGAGGADGGLLPEWPYHFRLRIAGADGRPRAATYYPSKLGPEAPVVLLIHDRGHGRSRADFELPLEGHEGMGLAEYLQDAGYAVVTVDLLGHGENARLELTPQRWASLVADLETVYGFLIDRNNRRGLNLTKFGVVGLGQGANLVAAWAANGGAVPNEGHVSDLAALVLVSPVAEADGLPLEPALAAIAPRLPLLLMAGKRHEASRVPVEDAQALVERPPQRESRVAFFDTALAAEKLLRYEPQAVEALTRFLAATIQFKTDEWEPRYLFHPTAFDEVRLVTQEEARAARGKIPPAARNAAGKAAAKNAPKAAPGAAKAADPKAEAAPPAREKP